MFEALRRLAVRFDPRVLCNWLNELLGHVLDQERRMQDLENKVESLRSVLERVEGISFTGGRERGS